ncbi:MAG: hypothetical protein BWY06_03079 [Candidatus Latescibacteria bacterium ADurb.Bin168]|nr:MAG: hypothetical protein BWY06_03079 [Candidatus Latescibacteria bacterium ADurb.Bin168]
MLLGDVVDELCNQNRLANACATEQPDLASAHDRLYKVYHLDTGLEHFGFDGEAGKGRRGPVNRQPFPCSKVAFAVDGFADNVQHPSQRSLADRNGNRDACIPHGHIAHQSLGGVHGNGPDLVLPQVLRNLQNQALAVFPIYFERIQDRRQCAACEVNVYDRAHDLNYFA